MSTPTTTAARRRRPPVHGRRPVRRVAGHPTMPDTAHEVEWAAVPVPAPRIHPRHPQRWQLTQLAVVALLLCLALAAVMAATTG